MSKGGWSAFREKAKQGLPAADETGAEILSLEDRLKPDGAGLPRLSPAETPPSGAAETGPDEADETDRAGWGKPVDSPQSLVQAFRAARVSTREKDGKDPADEIVAAAVALITPSWPLVENKPRFAFPVALADILPAGPRPWYALALVPLVLAGLLIAVFGTNPVALCIQWWDVLFGAAVLTAAGLYACMALAKGLPVAWKAGAPFLGVLAVIAPLWLAIGLASENTCAVQTGLSVYEPPAVPAAENMLPSPVEAPPLPPPVEITPAWTVPLPMPRPPELHYRFTPQQFDLNIQTEARVREAGL